MKRISVLFLLMLMLFACSAEPSISENTQPSVETTASTELATPSEETTVPSEETAESVEETIDWYDATVLEEDWEEKITASTEAPTEETIQEVEPMLKLTIGGYTLHATFADTTAAEQLKQLLQYGAITMSAYNYGGFEKVCDLGYNLSAYDVQTTTTAGDIMLWSDNHIVIFYDSNTWAYTRLARVVDADIPYLEAALSGSESAVTIDTIS